MVGLVALVFSGSALGTIHGEKPTNEQEVESFSKLASMPEMTGYYQAFLEDKKHLPPLQDGSAYFGPEFTLRHNDQGGPFSKVGLGHSDGQKAEDAVVAAWHAAMDSRCKERQNGCRVEILANKRGVEVRYEKQEKHPAFSYRMEFDQGVLEFTMTPMSPAQIRSAKEIIQRDIFETGKNLSVNWQNKTETRPFTPALTAGGGHVHMDIHSSFNDSALQLRNMVVDLENHPAMFLGGISFGHQESPVALEPKESQKIFRSQLSEFDGLLKRNEAGDTPQTQVVHLASILSGVRPPALERQSHQQKSHLANLHHLAFLSDLKDESGVPYTLEIRGLNPQKDAETYALQTELFLARARYLERTHKEPIAYTGKIQDEDIAKLKANPTDQFLSPEKIKKNPFINKQQSVDEFYDYVTEAGLDWKKYKPLLNPALHDIIPTKLFSKVMEFLGPRLSRYCEARLKKKEVLKQVQSTCGNFLAEVAGNIAKNHPEIGFCVRLSSNPPMTEVAEKNVSFLLNEFAANALTPEEALKTIRDDLANFGLSEKSIRRFLPEQGFQRFQN